ncbi:MAG: TetR/AcrR family transcriptional regulator [Myxococcales bacterium]|nr:TetR/AcrR family transcriptional regulator [Myxococcales bacterium]MCB9691134.1 TetR/AcrR family transcriptional regulator [Alphaproteobacteria bacterium]
MIPAPVGTRDERKAETRRRILESARALLEERGAEATTMRAIAARADVSLGTVHNYVGSRAELVVVLFVDDLEGVIASRRVTLPDGPLLDRLLHYFGGFFALYAARPALSRTYVTVAVFAPDTAFALYMEVTMRFVAELADLIRRSGELRDDVPPALAARLCFDTYIGVVVPLLRQEAPEPAPALQALRQMLGEVLDLMRPRGSA